MAGRPRRNAPENDTTATPADVASVRSVRRALAILRAFGPADRGLPLGEIARRADLDKATARRLLCTLIGEGAIEQHAASKDYALALGVLALSAGPTPLDALRRRAQPVLAGIAEATSATAFLAVLYEGEALCVETAVSDRPAATPVTVGARLKLHACAVPRVLMAFLPLEARMTMLSGPLPAVSEATPTDPFHLSSMLETIRQRGWESGNGEVMAGVASLGLPVRGSGGEVVAALGITGPQADVLDGEAPRHLDLLRGRVRDLERRIGLMQLAPNGTVRRAG